jgi:16S rRNA (uracil1498-N3)-methyltransferase
MKKNHRSKILFTRMSLPYFFIENIGASSTGLTLDEETSRHIVQVLRMDRGERLLLTDGKGQLAEAEITEAHKKHTSVQIISSEFIPRELPQLTIGISLIKNTSRFEWFLEKATELGTAEIIPLICDHTERQKLRHDRFISICKSAMLQSMQSWLPTVHESRNFMEVASGALQQQKMIAHCAKDEKYSLPSIFNPSLDSHIILIGPEGDFSEREINIAKEMNFQPVSLGNTRLRTETAGLFAAVVCRK